MAEPHQSQPIRLVIELDRNHEPIQGSLLLPERHAASFRGWLALASLIEATRAPDAGAEDLSHD